LEICKSLSASFAACKVYQDSILSRFQDTHGLGRIELFTQIEPCLGLRGQLGRKLTIFIVLDMPNEMTFRDLGEIDTPAYPVLPLVPVSFVLDPGHLLEPVRVRLRTSGDLDVTYLPRVQERICR
jgi:hypothetical protein